MSQSVSTTTQFSPQPNHVMTPHPSPRASASTAPQLAINTDLSPEALKKIYWGLGPENKWMECIDGVDHHLGKEVYDKGLHGRHAEPGFVKSMEQAFPFIENSLSTKIDAGWYLLLHKYTCAHFNGDRNAMMLMGQEKVGIFRDSDDKVIWKASPQDYGVTPEARAEFRALDEELSKEFGSFYGVGEIKFESDQGRTVFCYKHMSGHQVHCIFDKFLNEFYHEVEKATTSDEKLMAIAKLQQRLEWLHPVKDGSARTNMGLMNKHLTDYGFHPAILHLPHVSSTFGLQKWFEYLKDGLKKWEERKAFLEIAVWLDTIARTSHTITPHPSPRASASTTEQLSINTDLSPETLKKIYWGLGPENKWMECIDGIDHPSGKDVFDKGSSTTYAEPGFLRSMEEAFSFVQNSLSSKIDADWYLQLHKYTCAHFNGNVKAGMLMGQEKVGVFRDSDDGIYWDPNEIYYAITPVARAEFRALDAELKKEFGDSYGLGEIKFQAYSYKTMARDQVRRIFDKFLNEFYQEVEKAETADQKLMAIAKLHQRLEWLHPVKDGSARTNMALMNKHLTDYGFHPAILEYPHVSSSFALQKWFNYLKGALIRWEYKKASIFNPLPLNAV